MREKTDPIPDIEPTNGREQICRQLEERGVTPGFAREVADALAPFAEELGASRLDAVLSGVRLAYGVHRRSAGAPNHGAGELEKIERLMGAFEPELKKLDEALDVLTAYVTRLRTETRPAEPAPPTLH